MRSRFFIVVCIIMVVVFAAGCSIAPESGTEDEITATEAAEEETPAEEVSEEETEEETEPAKENGTSQGKYTNSVSLNAEDSIANEAAILEEAPEAAIPDILEPVASGYKIRKNENVTIDYSNVYDGYIMMLYTEQTEKKIKAQIVGPETTYTYNLYPDTWAVLPITDGDGSYQFKVFKNVGGNEYALVLAESCDVSLTDEFAPFIRPNQFVNYSESSTAVDKAWELTKDLDNSLEKVKVVYDYVVSNFSYDFDKAENVQSGYIPDLDEIMEIKKGICFDYAALMTGMLRSQGIPCKMVFGYAGSAYHAWISVWTEDTGWVDGVIFFDGTSWQRLDPTFMASSNGDESIIEFIGDGSNYQDKYLY